jgi:hypothetical protein
VVSLAALSATVVSLAALSATVTVIGK